MLKKYYKPLILAVSVLVVFVYMWFFYQQMSDPSWSNDWIAYLRPAMLSHNLYNTLVFNPPWTYLFLYPFAFLPSKIGSLAISMISIGSFVFVAVKLKIRPFTVLMVMLLPYTMYMFINGNVEWLVLLGFVMPVQFGLFFVMMKPQLGIGIAIYWFIKEIRVNGIRKAILKFLPATICFIAFLVYYLITRDVTTNITYLTGSIWNTSFWPYGLAIGIYLLYYAIKYKKENIAILSSGFIAPYIAWLSWPVLILGLDLKEDEMFVLFVSLLIIKCFILK